MAVTAWDSEGMDWSSMAGKPLRWCHAEALRLALVERLTAAGVAVPATLQTAVAAELLPRQAWCTAYHDAVSGLFAKFAQHTDSSGDWEGHTEVPAWTEASMLAAIGAASRVTPSASKTPVLSVWAMQQYAMLNLLLWTRYTPPHQTTWLPMEFGATPVGYRRQARGGDYATLAADWAGSSWVRDYLFVVPTGMVQDLLPSYYQATRYKWEITAATLARIRFREQATAAHTMSCVADLYWWYAGGTEDFYDDNLGLTWPSFHRQFQDVPSTNSWVAFITHAHTVMAYDTLPVDALHMPTMSGKSVGCYIPAYYDHVAVAKWDGAGGFAFKAA
jgi:hypothetical protein